MQILDHSSHSQCLFDIQDEEGEEERLVEAHPVKGNHVCNLSDSLHTSEGQGGVERTFLVVGMQSAGLPAGYQIVMIPSNLSSIPMSFGQSTNTLLNTDPSQFRAFQGGTFG